MAFKSLSPHMKGVILTFLGGLALSFDIPIVRLAEGGIWSILTARSLSTVAGLVVLWLFLRLRNRRAPRFVPGLPGLAVCVLYALSTVFFLLSVFHTSTANVAFILAFNPMFGALLSWIFLRERPQTVTFIAMAVMLLGITLIVGSGLEGGHLLGDLSAALSALGIAGALTISRAKGGDFGYTPLVATIFSAAIGGVLIADTGFEINHSGWIIFNGLIVTPFAFWALATGPRYLSAAETGMFYLLETVLAPIWVWIIFGDHTPLLTIVGGLIILAALIWHSLVSKDPDAAPMAVVPDHPAP